MIRRWAFLSALLVAAPLFALTPSRTIRQYVHASWQDQLPHSTVLALTQTRDGYLWVGTHEGLARFNGSDFTVFDKRNSALEAAGISALLEDSGGTLWIGTVTAGLYRLVSGAIVSVRTAGADTTIHAIAEDRAGTLWLATNRGIERLARSDGHLLSLPPGSPRTTVRSICAAGDEVWFATEGEGVIRYANGGFTSFTTRDGLSNNAAFAVIAGPDGGIWIGTQHGGIDIYRNGRFEKPQAAATIASTTVFAGRVDRDGNVWLSVEGEGICRLAAGHLTCDALSDSGAPDIFRSMTEDREGNLWLGGTSSGLHRLTDGKFTTTTSETGSNSIRSVTETLDGTIWTGIEGGGVQALREGRLVPDPASRSLPSPFVRTVLAAPDGSLWVGTISGLTHISGATPETYTVRDGLATSMVYALHFDLDGSLWIGTSGGLSRFSEGKITTVPSDGSMDVRAIHVDKTGRLWIGSRGGLRCLAEGRVIPCGDGILAMASIFSFDEEPDGTLWIGTNRGLVRIRNGATNVYSMRDGLYDDVAFAILDDDAGNLWMSCNRGIYRVRKTDFDAYDRRQISSIRSQAYDKGDGMRATQCNGATQPAAWKSGDGRLWFASVAGLVTVDPHRIATNPLPPPVVVERVVVNGRPAERSQLDSLSPGSRDFEFHYAALSFTAPEKVRYRYMLEGFDRDWVDAGARRVAYYTNVPHGRFTFRVSASNNDGVWNRTGASVVLRVRPHVQETWWFRALLLIAIVAVLTIAYRARAWQLREQERHAVLEQLATIDPLTHVANRRALDAALARMWSDHQRRHDSIAAILCDIDHFKNYNDTYGHQAGDDALTQVARALAAAAPSATDIVSRFGGEEFLILLAHSTPEDAARIAAVMLQAVRDLRIEHRTSLTVPIVTISLGVAAMVPDEFTAPQTLIREADEALYRAKQAGRNQYAMAAPVDAQERTSLP
ncbi:MAG TPA: diguanylate cyclase [Thermoanaerobaculia bacterium]|nr:diguanylate cyclase [Thermoanaerobaculia bacterium]